MCGVFGVFGHKDASSLVYLGLYALQHRGEESAGIASFDGKRVRIHKGMGLVSDVFDEKIIKSLRGEIALGHNRYSTTGSSSSKNIQPFLARHKGRHILIAHNGNLTNTLSLRQALEEKGSIFQTTMDSEIIAHLLAHSDLGSKEAIVDVLSKLEGAYSLALLIDGELIGARDPYGFRPLCLGRLDSSYILASETCALDLIGASFVRDVEPGEVVFISKDGLKSVRLPKREKFSFCIFEFIYFARPDSDIFGANVYLTRKSLGEELAKEAPLNADIVMPIPDSGNYAAMGFAKASDIPLEVGMIRNHYVGRTFIQPSQYVRDFRVKVKLNPIKKVLRGRRVVIVEDSIVRGTTSKIRVKTLREAGAREVHMRVSCPPLISPCYYGIDFPTRKELIASSHSVEWIRDFMDLDSLKYLSLEGMLKAMFLPAENFCTACFTGKYPTSIPKRFFKSLLEER